MTLYSTQSPITKDERVNINKTWDDILRRFNNLQRQINILAGDNDVDELIKRIQDALDDSESTLAELQVALSDASDLIDNMINATIEATEAATAANQATADTIQIINDLTALQSDLEQLRTSLEQIITDATTATSDAINATTNANQAADNANDATTAAIDAASRANTAAEAVEGWGTAVPWNSTVNYVKNNVVTDDGSTWQALHPNINIKPLEGADWTCIARKGLDGQGAVQTVNNQSPDQNGNVDVGITNITGLQVALNDKANDADLTLLDNKVTTHLDNDERHLVNGEREKWTNHSILAYRRFLAGAVNFNEITEAGYYHTMDIDGANSIALPPISGGGDWSILKVEKSYINNDSYIQQTITAVSGTEMVIASRVRTETVWKPWRTILTDVPLKWYEATMINGFTGQIRFGKNALGTVFVEVYINNLASITPGTLIATLPTGYRPGRNMPITINQANMHPYGNSMPFLISNTGELVIAYDNKLSGTSASAALVGGASYYAVG